MRQAYATGRINQVAILGAAHAHAHATQPADEPAGRGAWRARETGIEQKVFLVSDFSERRRERLSHRASFVGARRRARSRAAEAEEARLRANSFRLLFVSFSPSVHGALAKRHLAVENGQGLRAEGEIALASLTLLELWAAGHFGAGP